MPLRTKLTEKLGISHPLLLAPMGTASGGTLAKAVTEAAASAVRRDGVSFPRYCCRAACLHWRLELQASEISQYGFEPGYGEIEVELSGSASPYLARRDCEAFQELKSQIKPVRRLREIIEREEAPPSRRVQEIIKKEVRQSIIKKEASQGRVWDEARGQWVLDEERPRAILDAGRKPGK